ncbi:UNVERIFIED_ORG: hypothetical protein RHOFW104R5_37780 [Rhodanobacter sp. FW104-R5]
MHRSIVLAATFGLAAVALAGCSTVQRATKPIAAASTALTSCEQVKVTPPALVGAARTGANDQPVLIVGCPAQ